MEKRTEDFVKATENFINCFGIESLEVARSWAGMHRYLVNAMFNIVIRFIGILAKNYEDGNYDGRNEYSCYRSKIMIDALTKEGEWDDCMIEDSNEG